MFFFFNSKFLLSVFSEGKNEIKIRKKHVSQVTGMKAVKITWYLFGSVSKL